MARMSKEQVKKMETELDELWQELLATNQKIENKVLRNLLRSNEYLSTRAGKKLLEQSPSNEDLRYIIYEVEDLRIEAGKRLLKQSPSNEDLQKIIYNVEDLRIEAGKRLLKQNPSNKDLQVIINEIKELSLEARLILKRDVSEIIKEIDNLHYKYSESGE